MLTRRIASCVVEAKRKIASTFGYAEDTQRIQRGKRGKGGKRGKRRFIREVYIVYIHRVHTSCTYIVYICTIVHHAYIGTDIIKTIL